MTRPRMMRLAGRLLSPCFYTVNAVKRCERCDERCDCPLDSNSRVVLSFCADMKPVAIQLRHCTRSAKTAFASWDRMQLIPGNREGIA